ncbi:UDP-N-acetylglucosamine 1-carboxyvinyltransferase [Rickettsiales bacterium LUAb2]
MPDISLRLTREAKALRANIKKRNLQKNMRNTDTEDRIIINGGNPLIGNVTISGAKNSALPLIFASILADAPVTLNNVPNLSDIDVSIQILKELNANINFKQNTLTIDPTTINCVSANKDTISQMRASVLVLGPLLAKCKIAKIALPGGCSIGARPIDIHLDCLKQLGAEVYEEDSFIVVKVNDYLKAAEIEMQKASVGATENLLMAATLAKGVTKIINPAREPEIVDLANMLNQMGAKITGAGTNLIEVEGVQSLNGVNYNVCPDRIEAGSYAIAAAITGGDITLNKVNINDLSNILDVMTKAGIKVSILNENTINIKATNTLLPVDIITSPYPGFPTDMQPQWTTLMTQAIGTTNINETIFENRLGYALELNKMGANINIINKHQALVIGKTELHGSLVTPTDLRASFSLILAGLVAKGTTIINKLDYLDRGYEDVVTKLSSCGADITRISNAKNLQINEQLNSSSSNNLTTPINDKLVLAKV